MLEEILHNENIGLLHKNRDIIYSDERLRKHYLNFYKIDIRNEWSQVYGRYYGGVKPKVVDWEHERVIRFLGQDRLIVGHFSKIDDSSTF